LQAAACCLEARRLTHSHVISLDDKPHIAFAATCMVGSWLSVCLQVLELDPSSIRALPVISGYKSKTDLYATSSCS
jgi:hypothetical protein